MAAKFAKLNNFTVGMGSKWRNIKMINCGLIFITYITSTYMAAFQDHPLFLVIFNSLAELFFYFEVRAVNITHPVKLFLQNTDIQKPRFKAFSIKWLIVKFQVFSTYFLLMTTKCTEKVQISKITKISLFLQLTTKSFQLQILA